MCGRFTQRRTWHEIHELHGLTGPARNLQAQFGTGCARLSRSGMLRYATAERNLGDVSAESGIDRIYSRWKYFPQMKAALEAYKRKLAGRRFSMVVGATCGRKTSSCCTES